MIVRLCRIRDHPFLTSRGRGGGADFLQDSQGGKHIFANFEYGGGGGRGGGRFLKKTRFHGPRKQEIVFQSSEIKKITEEHSPTSLTLHSPRKIISTVMIKACRYTENLSLWYNIILIIHFSHQQNTTQNCYLSHNAGTSIPDISHAFWDAYM